MNTILRLVTERYQRGEPLKVVDDQVGSPTYAADLAGALANLAAAQKYSIYHLVNSGQTSWFGLAREICRLAGFTEEIIQPVKSTQFPRPARRPAFSVLDTSLAQKHLGINLRSWPEALGEYLREKEPAA